ncbi:MAG: tRNA (N(6)-L-threonylcarbamoyladenosine(37)-C(2))-methylthiotransferase MtaB [bacterium]|nr:tRNA (N(6)-L-threonylcarbamoyladenosine(37)-C(2))-methylthiotransferase MtaB [bacterium]
MAEERRIAAATLGCKLNQYETEAVVGQFRRLGWVRVPFETEADLVLIDTCTVTDRADQKARHLVRQVIRRNPEAIVVVMGCYGQSAARELARIPGVDYVVGTRGKLELPQRLEPLAKQDEPILLVARPGGREDRELLSLDGFEGQTRAWLKIQDGCDVFCSFCIIPFTRGRSRSMLPDAVLRQARRLIETGFRELVVTGVHIGDYGRDLQPARSLAWLCQGLLELPGLIRLRLSSIEPWDITDDLLRAMAADPRFCPHLHTALQSGSDAILAAMGRRIDRRGLLDLFGRIERLLPGAGLGTDLIAGFPGEEDAHHRETMELLRRLPLSRLHVFPFSPRSGTGAARLPGAVPRDVKRARCRELLDLGQDLQRAAHQAALGRRCQVLVEGSTQGDSLFGYTADYLRVELPLAGLPAAALAGGLHEVILLEDRGDWLRGRLAADGALLA